MSAASTAQPFSNLRQAPGRPEWQLRTLCIDGRCAYAHFGGLSLDQAFDLFCLSARTYQEDLVWMPEACFSFYVQAYSDYILSDFSANDSDAASCYISLVAGLRDQVSRLPADRYESLVEALRRIASSQKWFGADEAIHGSYARRVLSLRLVPLI